MTTSPLPQNTPTAANQLGYALEHALEELRTEQNANTIQDAQAHSQIALNILVGTYGRWYTKSINIPLQNDPILKRGILPGEKIPAGGADLDPMPEFPHGLALLTMGTATTPSQPLTVILGNVKLWQTQPRAGYDAIQNAIENADAKNIQLGKLEGNVPRAVAWLRLALTNAQTLEQAHAFATQARTELENALAAAKQIAE